MIKKIFLLLFVIINFYAVEAQSFSEVYNELYDRYDFIDGNNNLIGYRVWNILYKRWDYKDTNGNLYGYRVYNQLYKRWDFIDLRDNSTQNSGVTNYGKVESPINTELTRKLLAYKQAQYDALSIEQKRQLARQASYNNSREWVIQNLMAWNPKFRKKQKRQDKSVLKVSNTLKRAEKRIEKLNLNNLIDGIYEVVYIEYDQYLKQDLYYKRYILIENHKPTYYTNGDYIVFNVDNFKDLKNGLISVRLSNDYHKFDNNLTFYIPKQEPLKEFPEIYKASKYTIYTQEDLGGEVLVDIYNIKTGLSQKVCK